MKIERNLKGKHYGITKFSKLTELGEGRGEFRTEDCKGLQRAEEGKAGEGLDRINMINGMGEKAGGRGLVGLLSLAGRAGFSEQNRLRPSLFFARAGEVLRLRLGEILGGKGVAILAFAQDDRIFKRCVCGAVVFFFASVSLFAQTNAPSLAPPPDGTMQSAATVVTPPSATAPAAPKADTVKTQQVSPTSTTQKDAITTVTTDKTKSYAPVTKPSTMQSDPFSDPLIKQVQERHTKAVNGDTAETKSLTTDLEEWTKEQPNNHLLQVYLGSVYTLDSRDAWPGPGKLTYLRNGGKEMDAAVDADPDNPAVRFVRAINYYSLPTFFGKRQTARDDFQILVKQIEGVIQTPFVLNVETQQAIYYYAGLCYKQLSQTPQAKEAWGRGWKLNPTSALGVKIAAELKNTK